MSNENFSEKLKAALQDTKQVVVGCIILAIAVVLLVVSLQATPSNETAKVAEQTENAAPVANAIAEHVANNVATENTTQPTEAATQASETTAPAENAATETSVEENAATEETSAEEATVEENVAEEPVVEVEETVEIDPEHVAVSFTLIAEKDLEYKVLYTTDKGDEFNEEKSVTQAGKAGKHTYTVILPESQIARLRINMGEVPGTITITDIHLDGSQKADLSDFTGFELNQIKEVKLNDDGSLSFLSDDPAPFIIYLRDIVVAE